MPSAAVIAQCRSRRRMGQARYTHLPYNSINHPEASIENPRPLQEWRTRRSCRYESSRGCLKPKIRGIGKRRLSLLCSVLSQFNSGCFQKHGNLLEAIRKGYDIVPLFADVTLGGKIFDNEGHEIPATQLIQCCSESDVKLLWLASPNKPEGYIKGFKAAGTRLNLIMTLDRKDSRFTSFLENLLRKMSAGQSMPLAWVSLSPENSNDPRNQDAPACIFAAGRGGVRLC